MALRVVRALCGEVGAHLGIGSLSCYHYLKAVIPIAKRCLRGGILGKVGADERLQARVGDAGAVYGAFCIDSAALCVSEHRGRAASFAHSVEDVGAVTAGGVRITEVQVIFLAYGKVYTVFADLGDEGVLVYIDLTTRHIVDDFQGVEICRARNEPIAGTLVASAVILIEGGEVVKVSHCLGDKLLAQAHILHGDRGNIEQVADYPGVPVVDLVALVAGPSEGAVEVGLYGALEQLIFEPLADKG